MLVQEDMAIHSVDLSCWGNPDYTLHIKEMDVIVDLLNSLSIHCQLGVWFCVSPGVAGGIVHVLSDPVKRAVSKLIRFSIFAGIHLVICG
jgi:hypothetical protein